MTGKVANNTVPSRHADYQLGDEFLVNATLPDEAIYVSQTAALIWSLCDGRTTVAELIDLLSAAFPDDRGGIGHDVVEAVAKLAEQGALMLDEQPSTR